MIAPGEAPLPTVITNWQSAERAACEWMRGHGWPDAAMTTPGADAGLDVIAAGAVAQVKYQVRPVGRPALQKLAGAAPPAREMLFFSNAGFSAQAIGFGRERSMGLYTYTSDAVFTAILQKHRGEAVSALSHRATKPVLRDARYGAFLELRARTIRRLNSASRQAQSFGDRRRVRRAARIISAVGADERKLHKHYSKNHDRRADTLVQKVSQAYERAQRVLDG